MIVSTQTSSSYLCVLALTRDVLQCTMITHQVLLRGAAQCYLLQTAMRLVDVVSVPVRTPFASLSQGVPVDLGND